MTERNYEQALALKARVADEQHARDEIARAWRLDSDKSKRERDALKAEVADLQARLQDEIDCGEIKTDKINALRDLVGDLLSNEVGNGPALETLRARAKALGVGAP
jgi:hypothetical protein